MKMLAKYHLAIRRQKNRYMHTRPQDPPAVVNKPTNATAANVY
jgi:hypothetical protein